MSDSANDLLLQLQLKLPTHTYRAVKRWAEGFEREEDAVAYLEGVLAERERSEGTGE